jgi:hypothetical protein
VNRREANAAGMSKIMADVAAASEDSTAIIDFIHSLPKNLGVAASSARA